MARADEATDMNSRLQVVMEDDAGKGRSVDPDMKMSLGFDSLG